MDTQSQIDALNKRIDELEKSSTIPRSVETAFKTRFTQGLKGEANATYQITVNNGDTLTLPTITGVVAIDINGTTYNFMYQ